MNSSSSIERGSPGEATGEATGEAESAESRVRRVPTFWFIPVGLLVVVWLVLAFSSGGYLDRQWLLPALGVAALTVAAAATVAYPRRPRQLSLVVLLLFFLYGVWVVASLLWAESADRVWDEAGRAFFYILVLGLALIYLTDRWARLALRYLLLAAAIFLIFVVAAAFLKAGDLSSLFLEGRLIYPISYPNNNAALFLVPFWPLLWLAVSPRERVPVRGLALGCCSGLLAAAFMTQSRGAVWAMGLTCILMFLLSPSRLRLLVYLIPLGVLMVWAFPDLNRYWTEGPAAVGESLAAEHLIVTFLVATVIGTVLALLEGWIRIPRQLHTGVGIGAVVVTVGLLIYGYVVFQQHVGDTGAWLNSAWRTFTQRGSGGGGGDSDSFRVVSLSGSGRWELWRVAWKDFQDLPVTGVGAGNYVFTFDRLGSLNSKPKDPHSIELRVLAETGVVGGVLFFGALALGLGGMLWPRFSAGWYGARESWLRRWRAGSESESSTASVAPPDTAAPDTASTDEVAPDEVADTGSTHVGMGQPGRKHRWGTDPREYGWETALAVGVLYWLAHGTVEWLWHTPGASLPAILIFALGVAHVDARAEIIWPRAARLLSRGRPYGEPVGMLGGIGRTTVAGETAGSSADVLQSSPEVSALGVTGDPGGVDGVGEIALARAFGPSSPFSSIRRADKYEGKQARRLKRERRRENRLLLLSPPGPLSRVFRWTMMGVGVLVFVGLLLPYLSLKYEETALGRIGMDDQAGLRAASISAALRPTDPGPLLARADVYRDAARAAAVSGRPGRTWAALDNLALSIRDHRLAVEREPASASLHYGAGVAVIDFLTASQAGSRPSTAEELGDWAGLALPGAQGSGPLEPGTAPGPLVKSAKDAQVAAEYRDMTPDELHNLARGYLEAARERDPGNERIKITLDSLLARSE